MKRYLTPLILNHTSSRRYDRHRLLKAVGKLTPEEQADLFAILQDKTEEAQRYKTLSRRGMF